MMALSSFSLEMQGVMIRKRWLDIEEWSDLATDRVSGGGRCASPEDEGSVETARVTLERDWRVGGLATGM